MPSPMCPCGNTEQDTAHVLDKCRNYRLLRKEVWPVLETLHSKLYGPLNSFPRTTHSQGCNSKRILTELFF